MPDTSAAAKDRAVPPRTPPATHPMDPRLGDNLSPMFAAFLSWLLDLPPMTSPAITNIAVSGNSVLAATTDDPLFDAHLGSVEDFERNLRGWGDACGADPAMVDRLPAKLRRVGVSTAPSPSANERPPSSTRRTRLASARVSVSFETFSQSICTRNASPRNARSIPPSSPACSVGIRSHG